MEENQMSRREKRKNFRMRRNRIVLSLLALVSAAVFLYAGWQLWGYYADHRQEEMLQQELVSLRQPSSEANVSEENGSDGKELSKATQRERTPEDIAAFYQMMKGKNEDYICWLTVVGTSVDYPVVQKDNAFYLNHNFEGEKNRHGSIFLDEKCNPDGDVLLFHGHHMKDETMFGELKKYKDDEFRAQHEFVTLEFEDGVRTYRIFAVAQINLMDEESFRFENVPQTKEEKVLYIEGLDRASFWCEDDIAEESVQEARFVILSTCDYGTEEERLLVAATEVVSP